MLLKRCYFCIYCEKAFECKRTEGDHVIPAVFGEFENDKHFYNICRDCNSAIGKAEEELIRCSPEAVFSRNIPIRSSRLRNRKSKGNVGASGTYPPADFAKINGENILVSRINEINVEIVDQLILTSDEGVVKYIKLYRQMRVDQLKDKVKKSGIKTIKEASLNAPEGEAFKYYHSLLSG